MEQRVQFEKLPSCSGKTWVIGDVHGYVNTLRTLLDKLELNSDDRIIMLGDLIDRGPDSKGVLDVILDLKAAGHEVKCLMGNHEQMMLKSYKEELDNGKGFLRFLKKDTTRKSWLNMGGDTTMKSFGAKRMLDIDPMYFDFIESMSHYLEDPKYFYAHAGFNFESEDPFTDVQSMLWIRDFKVDTKVTGNKKVVHGHTPIDIDFIKDVILHPERDHFIALDNGVYLRGFRGKGRLLAFETGSNELIEQKAQDTDY